MKPGLSELQDAICQCKQLRTLYIGRDEGAGPPQDASSLLMDFSAALPNLTALQWLEAAPRRMGTRHTFSAFVSVPYMDMKATESLAGPGLRLLQAEQCRFEDVPALPASLQMCSLRSWELDCPYPLDRLHLLLAPCAALRELYILRVTLSGAALLDLPSIAATCPALQVLVLHVLMEDQRVSPCPASCTTMQSSCCFVLARSSCGSPSARRQFHHACAQADPFGKGEVVLPRLEVLIIVNTGMETDDLLLR